MQLPFTMYIYDHASAVARAGAEYAIRPRGGEVRYVGLLHGVWYDLHEYLAPLIIASIALALWDARKQRVTQTSRDLHDGAR
ncbi:MAG: hypothetical protein HY054_08845 [Proteobacteria bacterium]|nr:hypothetical protein [Pseudomonadota bacterium]